MVKHEARRVTDAGRTNVWVPFGAFSRTNADKDTFSSSAVLIISSSGLPQYQPYRVDGNWKRMTAPVGGSKGRRDVNRERSS